MIWGQGIQTPSFSQREKREFISLKIELFTKGYPKSRKKSGRRDYPFFGGEEGLSLFFSLKSMKSYNWKVVAHSPLWSCSSHLFKIYLLFSFSPTASAFSMSSFRTSWKGRMGNGVLGPGATSIPFTECLLRPKAPAHVPLPQNRWALLCLWLEECWKECP